MISDKHIPGFMAMILLIMPVSLFAQMADREQILADDISRLGERAVRDMIISEEECSEMLSFVRDSLPEDFVTPGERRRKREQAVLAGIGVDRKELIKHVKPLQMKPWLMATLRMLFGSGVNQRPERWDYTVVPQMGGLYTIIMPGGKPDDSWRDAPPMAYDPHPDKHFRR